MYDPGPLVSSSINNSRKDFRSPFLAKATTWGYVNGKINKNCFTKEYRREFVGKDSPPPTTYDPVDPIKFQKVKKDESKSMSREVRVCPIVSKHQLRMPDVAPNSYQQLPVLSSFKNDRKNS